MALICFIDESMLPIMIMSDIWFNVEVLQAVNMKRVLKNFKGGLTSEHTKSDIVMLKAFMP